MDGEISGPELAERLEEDGDDPLVVDIRAPAAFQHERIPDSVNVPLGQLPNEVETIADAEHIVTVCPHGQASVRAARLITAFEGFDGRVDSLECGLTGWDGPLDGERVDAGADADAGGAADAPF